MCKRRLEELAIRCIAVIAAQDDVVLVSIEHLAAGHGEVLGFVVAVVDDIADVAGNVGESGGDLAVVLGRLVSWVVYCV